MELATTISRKMHDSKHVNDADREQSNISAADISAFALLHQFLNSPQPPDIHSSKRQPVAINFHQQLIIIGGVTIPPDIFKTIIISCDPDTLLKLALTCKKFAHFITTRNEIGEYFLNYKDHTPDISKLKTKKLNSIEIAYYYPLLRKAPYAPKGMFLYQYYTFQSNILHHRGVIKALEKLEPSGPRVGSLRSHESLSIYGSYLEQHNIIKVNDLFYSSDASTWYPALNEEDINASPSEQIKIGLMLIKTILKSEAFQDNYKLCTALLNAANKHCLKDILAFINLLGVLKSRLKVTDFEQLMKLLQPAIYKLGFETMISKENRPFSLLALNLQGMSTILLLKNCQHATGSNNFIISIIKQDPVIGSFNNFHENPHKIFYLLQILIDHNDDKFIDRLCAIAFNQLNQDNILNGELCYALLVKSLIDMLIFRQNYQSHLSDKLKIRDICQKIISATDKHGMKNCHLFFYRLIFYFKSDFTEISYFIDVAVNKGFAELAQLLEAMIELKIIGNMSNQPLLNFVKKYIDCGDIQQAHLACSFLLLVVSIIKDNSVRLVIVLNAIDSYYIFYKSDGLRRLIDAFQNTTVLNELTKNDKQQNILSELLLLFIANSNDVFINALMMLTEFAKMTFFARHLIIKQNTALTTLLIKSCIKSAQIYGLEGYENLKTIFETIIHASQQSNTLFIDYVLNISICIMTYGFKNFPLYSNYYKGRIFSDFDKEILSPTNISNLIQHSLYIRSPHTQMHPQAYSLVTKKFEQLNRLIADLQIEFKNENHAIVSKIYLELSAQIKQGNSSDKQQMIAYETMPVKQLGPFSSLFEAVDMETMYIKLTQLFSQRTSIMAKTMTQAKLCFLSTLRTYYINPEMHNSLTSEQIIDKAFQFTAVFFPPEQFDVKKEMSTSSIPDLIEIVVAPNKTNRAIIDPNTMCKDRKP